MATSFAVPGAPRRAARRGAGGVTLSDVAKIAGVSAITVSRALNTPAAVSADTLAKVRKAIARTGYVPNLIAGGLASNRSRLVAAVVPTIAGPAFLETIQALTEALADGGLQLMLGQSGYDGTREDALIEAIVARRPDGIVLTGILRSTQGRRKLLASGIPVVETWDLTPTPIDMLVGFSHEQVGAAAADFLFEHGRRQAAIVSANDHRASLRRLGFEARWKALGGPIVPCRLVDAPSSLGNGRIALRGLLAEHPKIDAVYCSSDVLAHGVLTEALAARIAVPRRLAVLGFGNLAFSEYTHPALTTVRIDGTAIGRQAARFLIDRIEGRNPEPKVRDIGFSIVKRGSV